MLNPLTLKLEHLFGLVPAEGDGLHFGSTSIVAAREDIFSQGEEVPHAKLVLAGIACHYKLMNDGRRAITAFLLPGDFTNYQMPERQRLDFSVGALTHCKLVDVPLAAWRRPENGAIALPDALFLCMMTDIAVQRAWLANIGQRPADRRMAHLLCELRHRLAMVGLVDGDSFRLLLTQQDLADALGLSVVHVNRVIQALKEIGLIRIRERTVVIANLARLEAFAEFDPAYLHPQDSLLSTALASPQAALPK